ncbi:hypothetical protein [Erwinia amylovora]|uniref:hypothetical protein n=1 Tax=Erwinia amylovora TaxID=552 RepID=UPI001F049049|nr:hypothetical protein [Erwinia amylovora]
MARAPPRRAAAALAHHPQPAPVEVNDLGVFFRLAVAVEDLLREPPRLVIAVVLAVVTSVNLTVLDGCLLPIPDSREERRLRGRWSRLNDGSRRCRRNGLFNV